MDPAQATVTNDELWRSAYGQIQAVGPVHRHMRRLLAEVVSHLEVRTAVDVGCGAGDNAALLRTAADLERLVGIDVSGEALARAMRVAPGEYHQLDIQTERLEAEFDLVFSSLLLEHLEDDRAAVENMRAMCRRWLVVSTIAGDFARYRRWDQQVGHVRNYARGQLEDLLRASGFEVVDTLYWGFPLYSPIARTLQNRATPTPVFGRATRLLAAALYRLYFLNSRRRGDLLIAIARPAQPAPAAAVIDSASVRDGE